MATLDRFIKPLSRLSSNDGKKKACVGPISIGITVSGLAPTKNIPVKIAHANTRFITTPATKTRSRLGRDFDIKAPSTKAEGFEKSSPSIRTNPPKGNALKVKSVHFLSVKIFLILGGIPNPNSKTFMPVILAVIKCPNS